MGISILRFPDGTGCRNWVIATVTCTDTGVVCYDSNKNQIGRVDTFDPHAQRRVADAIMDCLDAGKGFKQPDWEKLLSGNAQ